MRVYISGPITGRPLNEARVEFAAAAAELARRGYEPVNPFDVGPAAGCVCPDAVSDDGAGGGHTWHCYMREDLAALLTCDAILLLPGWQRSHGAPRELDTAVAAGIEVWPTMPDLVVADALEELARAEAKFPDQHLPDGTGRCADAEMAMLDRAKCQANGPDGPNEDNWRDVLQEEVSEAFAEVEPKLLRAELLQVIAVSVRWIRDINRRSVEPAEVSGG